MTNLERHYITGAARNSAEALSMAMQMWEEHFCSIDLQGVRDLVHAVNKASIALRKKCLRQQQALEDSEHNANSTPKTAHSCAPGGATR